MSAELGLHMPYVSDGFEDIITNTDIEARTITFWGAHALETTCAMSAGRIPSLPQSTVKLDKPSSTYAEGKIWKPHGHPKLANPFTALEQPSLTYNFSRQLSHLTAIVNDAGYMLYEPPEGTASQKVLQLYERYKLWYRNLPESLVIKNGSPTLPHVLALQ
jgi:hypothetical protein